MPCFVEKGDDMKETMAKKKKHKYQRLNDADRVKICYLLNKKETITNIAKELKRSKSTISREIKRNITIKPGLTNIFCSSKKITCNKCCKVSYCKLEKTFYNHDDASLRNYERRSNCAKGARFTDSELKLMEQELIAGANRKNNVNSIYMHSDYLQKLISKSAFYRLIKRDIFCVNFTYLIEGYKKKKTLLHDVFHQSKKSAEIMINRTFYDFKKLIKQFPSIDIFECDSVVGKLDDKYAILTIFSRKTKLQFGFLIKKQSSDSVNKVFYKIYETIGSDLYKKVFKIFLCDNGYEFNQMHKIEEFYNEKVSHVFFTRTYTSTDKAGCERNHRLLRDILEKGVSLDTLTQEDLNRYFSNINSKRRASLSGRTPYEEFKKMYGKEILDKLGIVEIPHNKLNFNK